MNRSYHTRELGQPRIELAALGDIFSSHLEVYCIAVEVHKSPVRLFRVN